MLFKENVMKNEIRTLEKLITLTRKDEICWTKECVNSGILFGHKQYETKVENVKAMIQDYDLTGRKIIFINDVKMEGIAKKLLRQLCKSVQANVKRGEIRKTETKIQKHREGIKFLSSHKI